MKSGLKIIGLIGYKQSGKTTAFQFIQDYFGKENTQEIMLAGKIKEVCSKVFDIPYDNFEKQELKEIPFETPIMLDAGKLVDIYDKYGITKITSPMINDHIFEELTSPRRILQYIGTEVLRSVEIEIHCRVAAEKINPNKINVITDIRFSNEFDYFSNLKGDFYPIFIHRELTQINKDVHLSEKDIVDLARKSSLIDNNDTLDNFRKRLEYYLQFIEKA